MSDPNERQAADQRRRGAPGPPMSDPNERRAADRRVSAAEKNERQAADQRVSAAEKQAFVGLGSNVGDRLEHLRKAVRALDAAEGVTFRRSSTVYETEPVGPPQPEFLNACIELRTTLAPRELLGVLKGVEGDVGRVDRERWGPREVDLDLLLYADEEVRAGDLRVPHPEMVDRAFVLVPLSELAMFARIPGDGRLVAELLETVDRAGVREAYPPESLWPERTRGPSP